MLIYFRAGNRPLAIDPLVEPAHAIVEAFNPGFGARQLAESLFGKANRWGKLPYTIYDKNYTKQVSLFSCEWRSGVSLS